MRLTPSRARTLLAIAQLTEQTGWPPTVREIGRAAGYRSTHTVHRKLVALARLGLVSRDNPRRMVVITEEGRRQVEILRQEGKPT